METVINVKECCCRIWKDRDQDLNGGTDYAGGLAEIINGNFFSMNIVNQFTV